MRRAIVAVMLLACIAPRAHALTADEHRRLSLQAFRTALQHRNATVLTPEVLSEITVLTSRDDMSPSRFQVRGLSPFQQANAVSPGRLEAIVADVIEHPPTDNAFAPYADNAVANYVVYHTLAMRCAEKARPHLDKEPVPRVFRYRDEWFDRALVFEAVALGYLGDCFSSSHILTPRHLWLTRLQGANVRAAHEFFATQGAYVYAGGEVWQTFGDGVLHWHGSAWDRAGTACRRSIEQVVQFLETRSDKRPPSLSSVGVECIGAIPTVAVACWSVGRKHIRYLQCSDSGLHAPDLNADARFLYSLDSLPSPGAAVVLAPSEHPLDERLRTDPLLESVEYHQTLDAPPAWAGLLLMTGGGVLMSDDGGGGVGSVAAGYGWEFRLPLFARLRTSLETEYVYRLGAADRRVLVPRYTVGFGSPLVPMIEAVHFEVGYAWGVHAPYKDQGVKWGVGVGTHPLRFPFTYAGVSLRAKYERFWLDEALDGFQLQFVFR